MSTELNKLLRFVIEKRASDLHLTVGLPPMVRIYGDLRPLNAPVLTPEDTVAFAQAITPERYQRELKEKGGADFGFAFEQADGEKKVCARFRVAIFNQKGNVGLSLRLIPSKLLSLQEIGLPPMVGNLLLRPRGLVLVTGPTGCGKTTTLASMLDFVNTETDQHIITIEDPIEYYHQHKKSIVTQREIGVDVGNFSEALRRALRMDPDVILVGEMRDLETIQAAITAAETGHLVLATLHTTGAARTVNRIIDAFPVEQQEQVRAQLSVALLAVFSQALLPRTDQAGLVAAFEIMIVNAAIANLIRENKTYNIPSSIQTGAKEGMVLLDEHLFQLYVHRQISVQSALRAAQNPSEVEQRIKDYTFAASQSTKKR